MPAGRSAGLRRRLIDTMTRAVRGETASIALMLDAKGNTAASFYERKTFIRLPGTPIRLLRCMNDFDALVGPAPVPST